MENQRRVMTRQEARRQGLTVDNEGEVRQTNQPVQHQYQNLRYGMEESAASNPPQQEQDQHSALTRRLLQLPPNSLQSNPIFPPFYDRHFPQSSNQQPHLLDMSDLLEAAEQRPNAAGDELMNLGPNNQDMMDVDVGAAELGGQMQGSQPNHYQNRGQKNVMDGGYPPQFAPKHCSTPYKNLMRDIQQMKDENANAKQRVGFRDVVHASAEPQVAVDVPVHDRDAARQTQFATAYNQNFYYQRTPNAMPQPPVAAQPPVHFPTQPNYYGTQQYWNPYTGWGIPPPPAFAAHQPQVNMWHPPSNSAAISQQQWIAPPPGLIRPAPALPTAQLPSANFGFLSQAFWEKVKDLKGGEGIDIVRDFFKKFDLATSSWPTDMRIEALHSKVSGRAERAFLAAREAFPKDYLGIRRQMLAQLDETDAKKLDSFDALMRGVKRFPNESIDQLGERIFGLVRRAYPSAAPKETDEYAIMFLIRALDNQQLSLNLELHRKDQSFDSFVAFAARAESTQRAIGRFSIESKPGESSSQKWSQQQQPNRQWQSNQNIGGNFQQGNSRGPVVCFNCDEPGHISRDCTKVRRVNGRAQQNFSIGNNVSAATGANRMEVGNKGQQQPQQHRQNVQNYLKQNLITVEQTENLTPIIRGIHRKEVLQFFDDVEKGKVVRLVEKEGLVGKIILLNVFSMGKEAKAVVDPGAQISLVSASFVYNLAQELQLDLSLAKWSFSGAGEQVYDVNGRDVGCVGTINLPIARQGLADVTIRVHITHAPFGYEFLLGTNCLQSLGFKLYDEPRNEMIEFEKIEEPKRAAARIIFKTTIQPNATQIVGIGIGESESGKGNVLVLPLEESGSFRVEPTIVGSMKTAAVPITNYSQLPITFEENQLVGTVEAVQEVGDAEDLLASQLIDMVCNVRAEKEEEEKEGAARGSEEGKLLDEYWKEKRQDCVEEKELVGKLVTEFHEIFALEDWELTQTSLAQHKIETGNAPPVKSKMRPVPYAYREKVAAMVQDYLSRGIVRPSQSPWASPIVIVPKKDGSLRFCVDYRGLNSVTTKDAYPLPNIDNTLLMLRSTKVFSTMDFMSGYWQIAMEPESILKTAFATELGLHEFTVMPFGLTNAVATFQRFMTVLFAGLINSFVFIYIDDILVASESMEQHLDHLRQVFERIREAGLKLKIKKCQFAASEIPFLGHILTRDGIKMDADKLKPVLDLPIPRTRKAVQSFLGFMTYYRKFVYAFGSIAAPLFRLLKEGVNFEIGVDEMAAIEELKEKIVKNVVLYFPNFKAAMKDEKRQFIIMTDASKVGLSAILSQADEEGRIRPIYFASRQTNKYEAKYSSTELEALAVRFGVKKFSQFITMIPTRIWTDHKALVAMFRSKNETGNSRVDKWIMQLSARFILKVEYYPGKANVIADLLSRSVAPKISLPEIAENGECAIIGQIRVMALGTEENEIFDEEREDWIVETKQSEFQALYNFLERREFPGDPKETQCILSRCPNFAVIKGLLYLCEQKSGELKLFVPLKFRKKLLNERHSGVCAGHQSGVKLFKSLGEHYFWPNLRSDCNAEALNCRICAHSRDPRANHPGIQMVKTSTPLELVCMDVLEIGKSHSKNRYILVIIDHFSKFVVAEAVPDKSSETVAKVFVEKFILKFGCPEKMHSDRGTEFINSTLNSIAKILKIKKTCTLGYDPNANGLAERTNRTILGMLKRNMGSAWDWDDRLQFCVFTINVTPSESTGFAPFHLLFGRKPNFPGDMKMDVNPSYTVDQDTYLQLFRENMFMLWADAGENLAKIREKAALLHDAHQNVSKEKFAVNERVMVIFPGKCYKNHRKLLWNHFGPFKIVSVTPSSADCVPADNLGAAPIRVPLKRLVKVPVGIPDICTLPKGRNPFKNILCALTKLAELKNGLELENREGSLEKLGTDSTLQSGTIVADFEWTEECSGRAEHAGCKKMLAAELDSLLDGSKGLGQEVVLSPIKALLGIFLLIDGVAKTIAAGQSLTHIILEADAEFELCIYSGKRADYVAAGLYPNEEDMKKAVGSWLTHCQVARKKIEETGLGPICTFPPCGVTALPEAERDGWKELFANGPWVLECVRAKAILRTEHIISRPRVLVGDSAAAQLSKAMAQTEFVGQEGPIAGEGEADQCENGCSTIAGIIRAFSSCYLSTKVQGVLVMLGKDSLLKGETPDSILEQFGRLLAMLERFDGVKIHWAMPPYINSKKEQYIEVQRRLQRLLAPSNVRFVMISSDGRSLAEIYRHGDTFDSDVVNHDGWLTEKGVRKMLAWFYTQLPSFPDDRSLGIRVIRSEIVVPQRLGGSGNPRQFPANGSARGIGPGDRPPIQHRVQRVDSGYRCQRSRSRSPVRGQRRDSSQSVQWRGRGGHRR